MNLNKYIMILAIGTGLIAISLLVFHIPLLAVRPLLLIALALGGMWSYYYWRQNKNKQLEQIQIDTEGQECRCHICKHLEATDCVKAYCSCCMIIKRGQIISHDSL